VLFADALKHLSGVLKESSHVLPNEILDPLGADVGCVPARSPVAALGVVVAAAVVVRFAVPRMVAPDTRTAAHLALHEPSEEVVAVRAAPAVAAVLFEPGQRAVGFRVRLWPGSSAVWFLRWQA
jgi:hypothetical protein